MIDTAYQDSFASDNLPPRHEWPELRFDLPEHYSERLNCAVELLDKTKQYHAGKLQLERNPERERQLAAANSGSTPQQIAAR